MAFLLFEYLTEDYSSGALLTAPTPQPPRPFSRSMRQAFESVLTSSEEA